MIRSEDTLSPLHRRDKMRQHVPFKAPNKRTGEKSMEISFFALPSKQGPVQGRFKPTHLLISLSTKVAARVRRFETPTPLNDGRTESKKDISMLTRTFLSCITLKRSVGVMC
jgi:hypothetical protein